MIQLVYPFCEKCGHEGICRYQKDLELMIKKMCEVTAKSEATHFQFCVKCPDFYQKSYSVKGDRK